MDAKRESFCNTICSPRRKDTAQEQELREYPGKSRKQNIFPREQRTGAKVEDRIAPFAANKESEKFVVMNTTGAESLPKKAFPQITFLKILCFGDAYFK